MFTDLISEELSKLKTITNNMKQKIRSTLLARHDHHQKRKYRDKKKNSNIITQCKMPKSK